ncbi:hypothetical protein C1H46_013243 [Malus baccata]|uniref:Uncharacterized protein n=1 Tax=Malus baccata TaxID=106549 RepID=A0A540MSE0_MALBA|nr:hypothetical protein C1H46_013243 [Malus baccata]
MAHVGPIRYCLVQTRVGSLIAEHGNPPIFLKVHIHDPDLIDKEGDEGHKSMEFYSFLVSGL